jgi:Sulfatase
VSPSLTDPMADSPYGFENNRAYKSDMGSSYKFDDPGAISELVAVYYASIEEVDHWVGQLVDSVYENNLQDETFIVFASDHGEMLGAHGMLGKGVLLEEAVRVPLILSFPSRIPPGRVVSDEVTTLDLHATILDYVGATPSLDHSDGASLRRFVERTSYNAQFDERVVVVEHYTRKPKSEHSFKGKVGEVPNFMVRKGSHKLIVPRKHDSPVPDMMFDLSHDPFELNNILLREDDDLDDVAIGKAEHLKALLVEWLVRNDKVDKIYSDPRYELGEGLGDIREVTLRRTWRAVEYWQSDSTLRFGSPSLLDKNSRGSYVRNEYFYVGRSLPLLEKRNAALVLESMAVVGRDAPFFRLNASRHRLPPSGGSIRIQVAFESLDRIDDRPLDARLVIQTNVRGRVEIPMQWDNLPAPSAAQSNRASL